jgi:hypothetical protein
MSLRDRLGTRRVWALWAFCRRRRRNRVAVVAGHFNGLQRCSSPGGARANERSKALIAAQTGNFMGALRQWSIAMISALLDAVDFLGKQ